MTVFQKAMLAMTATMLLIVCGIGIVMYQRTKPTREEQLAAACKAHPVDCERMRAVHATTARARAEAERYGLSLSPAIAELQKVQDEYDDRFIAEGYYGDARDRSVSSSPTTERVSVTVPVPQLTSTSSVSHGDAEIKSERSKQAPFTSIIPAAFRGEWNARLDHCGTDLNDSRLRIGSSHVHFYANDLDVNRVTIRNKRSISVETSFVEDGDTITEHYPMELTVTGRELLVNGITRQRCPS